MSESKFISQLKIAFNNPLPGLEAQAAMSPVGRGIKLSAKRIEGARKSAILVPIYFKDGAPHIILIQRAEYPGVHSGQFAFPGGRVEPEDLNTQETALRETEEEIGIPPRLVSVLGQLSQIFIPPSNSLVDPYVGFIENLPLLKLQESEVERTIHFPISTLLDDSIVKSTDDITVAGLDLKEVPYFEIVGNTVWGATASMLNELKVLIKNFLDV